jgi:hypothetical protein
LLGLIEVLVVGDGLDLLVGTKGGGNVDLEKHSSSNTTSGTGTMCEEHTGTCSAAHINLEKAV